MRIDLFRFSGEHIPQVAILFIRWPNNAGTHTGIVYRDENGHLYELDLQGNRELGNRPWVGRFAHVIPNTDDDAIANIASLCRVISRRNRERQRSGRPGEILYALKIDAAAWRSAGTRAGGD